MNNETLKKRCDILSNTIIRGERNLRKLKQDLEDAREAAREAELALARANEDIEKLCDQQDAIEEQIALNDLKGSRQ